MTSRSYLLLLFLTCLTFNSSASIIWKLQNSKYHVDTLSCVMIGTGTTQTNLALEVPVKLRIFYTTTDMSNPNVNLKLIMGKVVKTGIMDMCGACPILLQGEKILETQNLLDHLSNREPRSAIGYNSDGTKLFVDGRQTGVSTGVSSKDLAAIILNF